MKILVAIESSENPTLLAKTTLRWAARAGFNMRVFIPDANQLQPYKDAIDNANYDHFLDLPESIVEVGSARDYAVKEGYDLIVYLPDDMRKWDTRLTHDLNVLHYAKELGVARVELKDSIPGSTFTFSNGAVMERLK